MKKIIIIGAGISGLSTGCYAQITGFTSEIFEMHTIPGGVCTSWKRGDYLFDHCLHWVIGSNKGTNLYPIFKDLGISENIDFYHTDIFRIIKLNNKTLNIYTDINKFESELIRLFPDEKRGINKYLKLVRKFTNFNPPMDGDFGNFGFINTVKMLTFMVSFIKLKSITIEDYLSKLFKNDELNEMLFRLFPVKKMPAIMAIMPLSFMNNKEGGYPLGGSLNFAQTIEKKYFDLGGKINYKSKVKKINVTNGCVNGIILEDGKFVAADIVISACDGKSVLFDMLQEKYLTNKIRKYYDTPELWPPIISISLGINRNLSNIGEITDFKLKTPIFLGGREVSWSGFFHYCHDPNFAPKGKSVLQTQIETDYFFWKELYENDRNKYNQEKQIVLGTYIHILEEIFPGITEDIEITDIATPVTWERYTANWQGSYEGWMPTISNFGKTLPKKLPGLKHFYMTGQWIFPGGGVPMCMAQGKQIIKTVLNDNKKSVF
jgi:phytoene dehydrogenase-like protein